MRSIKYIILIGFLTIVVQAAAQRTQMTRVESGRRMDIDSVLLMADSVQRDSILRHRHVVDSMFKDSTSRAHFTADSLRKSKKFSLTRDTISAGNQLLLSFVPGMGQIYNRQFWKAPVFVGAMGGFIAGGLVMNSKAKTSKWEWQTAVNQGLGNDITKPLQQKMYDNQSTATVFYALAAATYLYSIADATFNFRGNTTHIRKATTLAALFPGAGFFYTRTYWRIPIYYAGFAVMASVIDYNNRYYMRFRDAYTNVVNGQPDEFGGQYSAEVLKNARDGYRRDRDFGIICTGAIYLLSIIDTYVIATLKNWDVSPDLGVTIEPTLFNERLGKAQPLPNGAGLSLKLRF